MLVSPGPHLFVARLVHPVVLEEVEGAVACLNRHLYGTGGDEEMVFAELVTAHYRPEKT